MALTKGQPMAVQICSRQICHSLAAHMQLHVVWVYTCFFKASGMKVHRELDISPLPLL
ncbi:hypothetical protein DSL61_09880 [Vibrio cholerae]|uniref:DUF3265 domain-containing protein n=1 Tax=Vibrio paracholerae TaxID=650003 RepID=A0ABD7G0T1_9VIBR|nr:hypothetical protein [Vibrio cholerae]RBM72518.1 hypothetical protein DLR72_00540 [Vibrio paracholerae]EGR1858303.1 hypothetical protein [Vibrio cholerae]OEG76530.1 hypothetical protein VCS12_15360 [Vibrio cholerae]RBO16493.1 hypothetical protein DSL61_09880 [Vibrio cholerae]